MSEPSEGFGLDGWTHTVVRTEDGRRAFQAAVDAGWVESLPASGKPRGAFLMKRLAQEALTDTVRSPAPEGIDVFGGSDGLPVRNGPRTGSPCSDLPDRSRRRQAACPAQAQLMMKKETMTWNLPFQPRESTDEHAENGRHRRYGRTGWRSREASRPGRV